MAAFSHLYHPFISDSAFLLSSPSSMNPSALTLPQERHHLLTPSDFSHFDPYSAIQHPQASYVVQNQESNFLKDSVSGTKVTFSHDSESSMTKRNSNGDDSTVLDKLQTGDDDTDSQKMTSMENKRRKTRRSSSLVPVKPKVAPQGKIKRRKKSDEVMQGKEKQKKAEKKVMDEPPKGYIHVRARRGQATDSHSLAERVRREKISERMRILQRLVPGCDKVTGKALMLDEIINYVQSLQNQVEFLSMRLTLNPTANDFKMDLNTFMVGQEKLDNIATCRPNLHLTAFVNATPATTIATPTATSTMANTFPFTPGGNDYGYTLFNNSDPVSVQGQRENVLDQETANRLYWDDKEDLKQKYHNPRHHATTYAMSTNGV